MWLIHDAMARIHNLLILIFFSKILYNIIFLVHVYQEGFAPISTFSRLRVNIILKLQDNNKTGSKSGSNLEGNL